MHVGIVRIQALGPTPDCQRFVVAARP
jgi:hypothetical protein